MGTTTKNDYVELRCRSAFSFLEGASLPEDLVAAAATGDHEALALGDRDGVYGAPRFFAAARKAGVQPIVGAEISLASGAAPVLLLVEDRRGYQNLCQLITAAKVGKQKSEPVDAPAELLATYAGGLTVLAGGAPRADLPALIDIFGRDRVHLEVQRHFDADQAHRNRDVLAQADALGIGVVATNDVRYATPAQRIVHDVLTCARAKATVDEIGRRLAPNAERWLKPPREMQRLFRDLPATVRATRAIAERCAFTLADLGYVFPDYDVPPGETQQSYLEQLAWAGVGQRYDAGDPILPRVHKQLARELGIIDRLGLAGYFLIVWDIVQFAKARGIMVQGRGSAANSAACFVLGITAVDPVRMDLLFERFLSEERVAAADNAADRMPDIDLDLPSGDQRELVIQHVYEKYGARGAAMTANVITYRPRMAVRDAGRALGLAEEQLNRIAHHLPNWLMAGDEPIETHLAAAGFPPTEHRNRLIGTVARALLNLPRHLGQHSGGMVIAAGRLDAVVPLEPASMPGRVVVQWDKDDCADLGIVKVDLLGLGMMAVLEEAVPMIRRHEGVTIDYAKLPPDDPKVYGMLRAADTVGVFQVESRAQMATLPRMKPTHFYDLVVEVAIIRPGPIVGKMVNPYLERRNGRETVRYPHPSLEPILKRTLGVPLFQEQLIKMAMVAAGFTGGQADELRRAMGFKRSQERMNTIEVALRAGMAKNGIAGPAQDEIIQGIKSFALYGFPESHAASFALLAYASAYLKAYHHAAFTAALLNAWPMGFYHPATLVNDAVRHGVEARPIDVTRSGWRCDVEDGGRALRLGLRYVSGLREETGKRIEAARAAAPFASLADVAVRAQPNERELTALAEVGALAALGGTRRRALWQVDALGKSGALFARVPVDDGDAAPLPEMTGEEEMAADFRAGSISTGPHPISFARAALDRRGVARAGDLGRIPDGRRAAIAGVVIVRQRPGTAKGFVFITLEDETGFANAIITPQRFARHKHVIVASSALIIEGVVQNQQGVVSIKADRFTPLDGDAATVDISHDFH
jgi:error-prone DNA polymerase